MSEMKIGCAVECPVKKIVLRPMPENGVEPNTPDGAYYIEKGGMAQVIVAGPMRHTPGAYVKAISKHSGREATLCLVQFMNASSSSKTVRENVMRRGFIDILVDLT